MHVHLAQSGRAAVTGKHWFKSSSVPPMNVETNRKGDKGD